MSEGQPPVSPAPPGGTKPLPGGVLTTPPAPALGVPPTDAAVPAPAPETPLVAAIPPLSSESAAPVSEGGPTLAETEQPYFSVMLLDDGQPIEFPVEMAGAEQDLGNGPIILQPNGRGVETSTHKYIAFDSGESAFYDLVSDPDGLNNIATDPAQTALMQELSAKLANFPAAALASNPVEETPPAPMEAIPVPPTPDIPKVTVPAPVSATPVEPKPAEDMSPVPAAAKPVGVIPPPLPKPGEIKLPEPGLPPGVGDSYESEEPVLAVLPPSPKPSVEIELPKPGLPKPSEVPELKTPKKQAIPPPLPSPRRSEKPTLPLPPSPKNPDKPDLELGKKQESSELKKDLLEAFDTDGDGEISKEENPTEEQLQQFTARRREKAMVDPLDNKRKSRIEAESAVKTAMRELEEARMREEMAEREELEAHKNTWEKAKRGREQCDEEIAKLKQADRSRHEKNEATIAKIKQEFEHKEELFRHGIRTKKSARLEDEDRIRELDDDLANLHEVNEERQRKEEEEDRRIAEERRIAKELFLEKVKTSEEERENRLADKKNQLEGEGSLKQELQAEEVKLQDKLRLIKFEDDDEHSRSEHKAEVLEKNREKFITTENIEDQEIRDLTAKTEARRMAIANEKKVERRMAVAEHEANLMNLAREEEEPEKEFKQLSAADLAPPSLVEVKSEFGKPNVSSADLKTEKKKAVKLVPIVAEEKFSEPNLPTSEKPQSEGEDVLPAIIKPGRKPALPIIAGDDEKPAFPAAEPSRTVSESVSEEKREKKGKLFGKLFGGKNKNQSDSVEPNLPPLPEPGTVGSEPNLPPLPKPVTEGPEPDLPPLPVGRLAPAKTSVDIPALPTLPSAKVELPPLPGGGKKDSTEELERKTLERKLERIADERAERMNEPAPSIPKVSGSPKLKVADDRPALLKSEGPAGGLPPLSGSGSDKPTLPQLPKPGEAPAFPKSEGPAAGGLPPLPGSGSGKPALPPLPKALGPAAGGLPPLSGSGSGKPVLPPLPKAEGPSARGLPPLPEKDK